jgi:hypothetical protein
MTATNPRDRETVRSLLSSHLPSGFPQPLTALTVGSVACRIQNEWQMGRLPLLLTDKAINDRLLANATPLPAELNEVTVRAVLTEAGAVEIPTALAAYWTLFLEQAHELIAERGRNFVPPHPRAF